MTSQPDGTTVTIHEPGAVDRIAVQLFGRRLSPSDWADAVGAVARSHVRVTAAPTASHIGSDGIGVLVAHPLFAEDMERLVYRAADGAVVCRNERFVLQPWARRRGIGATVFARQVEELRRLGVDRIEAEIAGQAGSPYNGYYRWALMGFDAPLTPIEQARLPPDLAGARTLHELLTAPSGNGVAWWKRHGSGRESTFDLAAGSLHSAILEAYISDRRP